MKRLSIFVIFFCSFVLSVSAAEIPEFEPSQIISESDDFPEYPLLDPQHIPFPRYDFGSTFTENIFECLPDDGILPLLAFLDYKTVAMLSRSSTTLYKKVNAAVDRILNRMNVKSCGVNLSRKDNFIVAFPLAKLFEESFPELMGRQINIVDFITCNLITLIISAGTRVENFTVVEPTCPRYNELRNSFLRMDFITRNINTHPGSLFPGIFRCPQYLALYFFRAFHFAATPFALNLFPFLHQKPELIKNRMYNDKAVVLFACGVSMARKDQRFLDNLIRATPPQEFCAARIGCFHVLHDLITKNGTYNSEVFKIPGLESIVNDCETGLSFFSAALFHALKHRNISMIQGLLNDFPNETFTEFIAGRIDILRNVDNFPDFLRGFGNVHDYDHKIMTFLRQE